mgnify:CR=1 FL=1
MAKIKPVGDKILVKRLEAKEKTKGGIVLPDTAKEKPKQGEIIALGDGILQDDGTRVPFTVKVDDRVIFASYAGTEIEEEGQKYLILSQDEILAVIK